jgi:polysaccharide transporter, PST family
VKRPMKNAAAFLLGDIGTRLLGFGITVYCARVLSPEGFGMMSIGFAVLGQLSLVASPGITLLEMRHAAAPAGGTPERVGGVLTLRAILALVLCTATWLIVRLTLAPGSSGPVTLLYVTALLPMALSLEWFFQGKEQIGTVSAARITTYLAYGAGVLLLVRSKGDVSLAAVAFVVGSWCGTLLLLGAYGMRPGSLVPQWRPSFLLGILRENLPVGLGMFLSQLVVNFPPLILGIVASHATVGTFGAAAKIAFLFLMADRLFNTLFLPILTRQITTRREEAGWLFHVTLKGVVLAMSIVATVGVLAASPMTTLVFGREYASSSPLLQIMMGYVLLTVVASVFVSALMAAGETGAYLRVSIAGGITLVVAATAGALLLGAPGAAYGMIIGETGTVLFAMREARKVLPFDAPAVTSAAGFSLGGLLLVPIIARAYGDPLAIGAGALILYVTTLLMGGIHRDEISYLKERLL